MDHSALDASGGYLTAISGVSRSVSSISGYPSIGPISERRRIVMGLSLYFYFLSYYEALTKILSCLGPEQAASMKTVSKGPMVIDREIMKISLFYFFTFFPLPRPVLTLLVE